MESPNQKILTHWAKAIESVRQKEDTKTIHNYWLEKAGGVMENCMLDGKAYAANNRALALAKMELTALVASADYNLWKNAAVQKGGQDAARLFELIQRGVLPVSERERKDWIDEKRPLPVGYSLPADEALKKVSRDFKTVGEAFAKDQEKGQVWVKELAKTAVMQGIDNDDMLWVKGLARNRSTLPGAEEGKVSFATNGVGATRVASIVKNEAGEYTLIKESPAVSAELMKRAQNCPSPSDPIPVPNFFQTMEKSAKANPENIKPRPVGSRPIAP